MTDISRRSFLRWSAIAGTAAGIAEAIPAAFASDSHARAPHIKFPTAVRERIAVASWPFRAYLESADNKYRDKSQPGMDLKDFAAHVVKEFHIYNLEPLSSHFSSTLPDYLHQFREAVDKAGSHVINIPVDGRDSFYDPDTAARKRAVDRAKQWIDIATVLGSPSIRYHIAGADNVKPDVQLTAAGLRQVAEYGAAKNVVVNLENDDLLTEDAFFIVRVIEKVNHPYLHALPDFCNSMLTGNADFNYRAIKAMFQHACNICHVKDSEVGDGGKVFKVDVPKTFNILKASGFRGYCSMEWEGGGNPDVGTRKLMEYTLKYL